MTRHAWYRRRLAGPLGNLLAGGLAPVSLARALTIGMLLGCMPLLWGTSLLCLGTALLLRLNPLAVQVGNFAAWPLQILFAYPYVWLGENGFGAMPAGSGHSGWLMAVLAANGNALGAWALTTPLLFPICRLYSRLLVTAAGRLDTARANECPKDGRESPPV